MLNRSIEEPTQDSQTPKNERKRSRRLARTRGLPLQLQRERV